MNSRGTTLLEYVMIGSLVAVTAISGIRMLASSTEGRWNYVADTVVESIAK